MAEAFVQLILENIACLIREDIGLLMGVDAEMMKLFNAFTIIQAVLEDAEMKQTESRAIQNWLLKLNNLIYEIDDVLDECTTEVAKMKHKNDKSSRYRLKNILFRRRIERRMKQVSEKLEIVAAERAKFHLREMVVEKPFEIAATSETGSTLSESHHVVYGMEEQTEEIVQMLVNQVKDNEEISVLPIIGVGGLGKTTLARLVFNDPRIVDHFDEKLWVCVSDNFDLKTLVTAMIECQTRSASDLACLYDLQRRLWELLKQKRYLIVLDDVWNEYQEKWYDLRNVLQCGSTGSSIILTTRLKKVADMMGTLPTYCMTGLSEEYCWMLLQERAFGQEEKEKFPNLEAIGKQIVKKCGGVPLAAKVLGGLLRFRRTENDWIHVLETEIWEMQEEAFILPALKLSYHHLPIHLRRCFAYCGVFPKDFEIRKDELIFLWMAHGYIASNGTMEVEDVGNHICDELVCRSLLQNVPHKLKPTVTMHDLIHDLAQSIMVNKTPGTQLQRKFGHAKIRQVNLREKYTAFPMSYESDMDMSFILRNFVRLRILDASFTGIKDIHSAVGNLKHLRQVNLSNTGISSLPESICSLWNLEVLNLQRCQKLMALPKNMRRLLNLRHLFLESCSSLREMPSKIRRLTCLRTLSLFVVGHKRGNQLEDLECLNLGGMLKIRHLERVENAMDAKKANLTEKKNLAELKLCWGSGNASNLGVEIEDEKVLEALEPHPNLKILNIKGFTGGCFPFWMSKSTLEKVVTISISNCEYCVHLPPLGELPHLKFLRLVNLPVKYIVEEDQVHIGNRSSILFPYLEKLLLEYLPNLKGVLKEQMLVRSEAFPNLEQLDITYCSSFKLSYLSSTIKKLKTLTCSNLTLASLSKMDSLTDLEVQIENMNCIPIETLQNLTNLKKLNIKGAYEMSLPEEGLRALTSLTKLEIVGLERVTCVPEDWLRHLTALEEVLIGVCSEIVELPEGIKHLKFLKKVILSDLPKMVTLPKALQQRSSSLQFLELYNLLNLESLPDWLDEMTSLESLDIGNCNKIASIPDSIGGMQNLRYLCIYKCAQLERRCERGKGEDWHKISHIRRLLIG